jgi:hypothetical protein
MDDRSFRIERGDHVRHRIQFFVFDFDDFRGVLGDGAAGRDDRCDRLALPTGTVDRDGMLRRRLQTLHVREHADPWGDDRG